ncbi:hypothetical protein [Candidatus Laterigemmans baculatus]|uniref:hypothetical protein n=1 Tax=Candidatus Laterigemmans baculatus TaxID=2770505 RepID=UPI0013DD00E7|nr:hypothetical protein [Candidatus Laterigemmans baculatus]
MNAVPFLTSYDPPGTSEGTLDPLGLYQIADQLAVRLVPAVRERMQRVRFLTTMALGALVVEGLESDPEQPEVSPFLVWEWLTVESIVRSRGDGGIPLGVPGTLVAGRALADHAYLDARSYLKTPRIFGFHGVYKRLAIHLDLVDVHLGPRPESERLIDAWARDLGYDGLPGCRPLLDKWRQAVERSLGQNPARTRPAWNSDGWQELAHATAPDRAGPAEKQFLRELLHAADGRALGALPAIWALQPEFSEDYAEEQLHARLEQELPSVTALVRAIDAYEQFCRGLHDAFDVLRATAVSSDASALPIPSLANDEEFRSSLSGTADRHAAARQLLGEVDLQLLNVFDERFRPFAEPLNAAECAFALCDHHETVQKTKGGDGKRAWFDRISSDRIYVRQQYRQSRRSVQPTQYVHDYRGWPIRNFYLDLQ